jgi:NAD(P)-dependent dehydrogenase (short-subunit alcohol dehydrogenase family)
VTAIQADASSLPDLDRLFGVIKESKGRLDVLFVNAGGGELVPLDQVTEEHYDRTFDTNVKGLLFTVQKALPIFSDGGSIILNASIVATKGFANLSVYSATKAAVRSFARTWTTDLQTRRIRVNSVSPGPIHTPGLTGLFGENTEAITAMAATVPLGRIGQPDEIATTVAFLASDESSFITGSDFTVDGGAAQI